MEEVVVQVVQVEVVHGVGVVGEVEEAVEVQQASPLLAMEPVPTTPMMQEQVTLESVVARVVVK